MKMSTLQRAIERARQFIDASNRVLPLSASGDYAEPGKETAAVKRASMELTRALADLRQNR
jgi:hypothetical protein